MDRSGAASYDRGMWALEQSGLSGLRAALVADLSGEVLELGAGTGANLGHYSPAARLTAIDLRPGHLAAAADKHPARRGTRLLACADAEKLPFSDGCFDAVVATLVFCSIGRPASALAEVRRVLRPGGKLRLIEHVRGQTRFTRLLTDTLHPFWFALQGECHLNRDTAATVVQSGFRIERSSLRWLGILQIIDASAP
jgi:ubiquinone/menaquinone biosynthesis C-methylase UbiE